MNLAAWTRVENFGRMDPPVVRKYPFLGEVIIRISFDFLVAGSFFSSIDIDHLKSKIALAAERLLARFFWSKIESYNQKSKIENRKSKTLNRYGSKDSAANSTVEAAATGS